jgi:hypothetical protein
LDAEKERSKEFGLGEGELQLASKNGPIVHFGNGVEAVLDVGELDQRHVPLGATAQHLHGLHLSELLEQVLEVVAPAGLPAQGGDVQRASRRVDGDGLVGTEPESPFEYRSKLESK